MRIKRLVSVLTMLLMVVIAFAEDNYKVSYTSLSIREIDSNDVGLAMNVLPTNESSMFGGNAEITDSKDFEEKRKSHMFEIGYAAGTFDDVKLSGSYGFAFTFLPWKIAPNLYAGVHCSPANLNVGLSDFVSSEIRLGPAIGYYFTPQIFISMPLDLLCNITFDDDDKARTAWGMALAPIVYIGKKGGVFIGPQFSVGFSGYSKVSCGFRAGIYF